MEGNTLILIASIIVLALGYYFEYKIKKEKDTH